MEIAMSRLWRAFIHLFKGKKALHEEFLKNYNREIDEAMASIDKGFFSKHEDVEKEAEKW